MKRFFTKIDKDGPRQPHMRTRCWVWTGSRDKRGYGRILVDGANKLAHRIAFELEHRDLSPGTLVLHECDHPPCVRPSHLHAGNYSDNKREAYARGLVAPMRGERSATAKLNANDVLLIRHRAAHGVSGKQLASEYGVTPTTISAILHHRTWRHL